MNSYIFKVLILLILFINVIVAQNSIEKKNFVEAVNKHRHYLLSRANNTLLNEFGRKNQFLLDLIKDTIADTVNLNIKLDLLKNIALQGSKVSPEEELNYGGHSVFYTGYIEDEIIYQLYVHAFKEDDLRETAYGALLSSREDYLKKYAEEIKSVILKVWGDTLSKIEKIKEKLPYQDLYMLLPLSKKEKSEFLNKIDKEFFEDRYREIHYLARLGDKKSEEKLITRFKKATTFRITFPSESKAKLAFQLGIAGTPECAKALISELYSPVADDDRKSSAKPHGSGNYKSIRVPIIKALGRIHPEARFLRMEISLIDTYGDFIYGQTIPQMLEMNFHRLKNGHQTKEYGLQL